MAMDGSMHDDVEDPEGNIHGCGERAVKIHHNDHETPLLTQNKGISNRTQINTTKLEAMAAALSWIIKKNNEKMIKNANAMKIISYSQHALNLLNQKRMPKDDTLIRIAREMDQQMHDAKNKNSRKNFIQIY